ncbi:LysR family transcriptional regulator [Roseibium salinum]|nr:LysR family transcriptional regulator [Roseibium salinum]
MSKSLPPLNWFRAFEAAARRLSFTAAGEEIGMTQSAVSQQIRALETRLGTTLFHPPGTRSGPDRRGAEPSAPGRGRARDPCQGDRPFRNRRT